VEGLETEGLFRESAPLGEVQKLYFSLSKSTPIFRSLFVANITVSSERAVGRRSGL